LYADVLRPNDIQQSSAVCLVVSDYRHHDFDDDSGTLTMSHSDDIEMNGLHSPHASAECEYSACGDVHGTTINHETNYSTNEDASSAQRRQNFDNGKVRVIVLDCCKVTFVDSMAAAALKKVNCAYRNVGVQLVLSGTDAKVAAVLAAAGVLDAGGTQIEIYPTIHDAVLAVA